MNSVMIYNHLVKRQKFIAWLLFLVFYADMVAAYAASKPRIYPVLYAGNTYTAAVPPGIKPAVPELIAEPAAPGDMPVKTGNKKIVSSENSAAGLIHNKALSVKVAAGPGPGQPEMATFKSVGSDKMVNPFTQTNLTNQLMLTNWAKVQEI